MFPLIVAFGLLGQSANPYVVEYDPQPTQEVSDNPYVVEVDPTSIVVEQEDKVLKAETEFLRTKLEAARKRREYFEKYEDPEKFGKHVTVKVPTEAADTGTIVPAAPVYYQQPYQQPDFYYPQTYQYPVTYSYGNGVVCGPSGCYTAVPQARRGLFGLRWR